MKIISSYSFQFNEMARPAGLEPAAFCLEGTQYKTLSAASGVAYEEARHLSRPTPKLAQFFWARIHSDVDA